jgi:hypothetical protein
LNVPSVFFEMRVELVATGLRMKPPSFIGFAAGPEGSAAACGGLRNSDANGALSRNPLDCVLVCADAGPGAAANVKPKVTTAKAANEPGVEKRFSARREIIVIASSHSGTEAIDASRRDLSWAQPGNSDCDPWPERGTATAIIHNPKGVCHRIEPDL